MLWHVDIFASPNLFISFLTTPNFPQILSCRANLSGEMCLTVPPPPAAAAAAKDQTLKAASLLQGFKRIPTNVPPFRTAFGGTPTCSPQKKKKGKRVTLRNII